MFKDNSERRADEERMKQENRLPPGQSLTKKFPVLHYGPVPKFKPAVWDFHIWGAVEREVRLSWNEFSELPHTKIEMDIHCVTKWSKFDTTWEGVKMQTLVDEGLLKLKPEANYVIQHAEYGYTANLPTEVIFGENFLLATHFDGEPITPEHGFPLRGVVGQIPGREEFSVPYFWKGAKWLRGLEFRERDQLGFWEQAGYHNEADVWKEQRYGRG